MSDVAAGAPAAAATPVAAAGAPVAAGTPATTATTAGPPGDFRLLHRVRKWGYVLLGLQLAGFLAWSAILYHRFSVTWDFAAYYQPWYLIAHGNLDPYSTILNVPFWRNDSEFTPWILAPLYWVTRTGLTLSLLQDISIAAAEAVAFGWLCEIARLRCGKERDAAWLAGLGLLLLLANPWIWWTVSFDVHQEPMAIAFAVLLARDLAHGKRRAWAWAAVVLSAGAPSATYVVGIGLGGVLAGQRSRRMGALMVALGVGYSLLIVAVHGDAGVSLSGSYGYLVSTGGQTPPNLTLTALVKWTATHLPVLVQTLWDKRVDMVANLAPGGALGIGAPVLLPLTVVILLADNLWPGFSFAEPIFQNLPLYLFMPVGTVVVLCWLARRHRRTALALGGLLAAQAVGWAAVWGPVTPGQWLRVSAPSAATLASVASRIPGSAEVIASQGVLGPFANRANVRALLEPGLVAVHGTTWFVILPNESTETASPATSMALIGELAGPLHATLITHANGVWAFRWTPPPGVNVITVPGGTPVLPAWTVAGAAGSSMTAGPASGWRASATGARGYVADGMEWQEKPGRYLASVTLSASAPVNVEVWDDNSGTLLARRNIAPTQGVEQVAMPVDAPNAPNAEAFSGWGPFHAEFVPPPQGQRLEIRVWSPGGVAVNVYSADLTAPSGAALPDK